MSEHSAILVCTVGGSHQPILTAVKARRWDRVVFVCTEGGAGSAAMVERAVAGGSPILALTGLERERWEMVVVPPTIPTTRF